MDPLLGLDDGVPWAYQAHSQMLPRIRRHIVEDLYVLHVLADIVLDPVDVVLQEDRQQEAQLLVDQVVAVSALPDEDLQLLLSALDLGLAAD